ncbi:hypothetical protein OEZ86_010448 [Tetradesmus obliquus]|nr:hypothetical protein OEZ86_010448 [Tetradesmus obliquus]
MLVDPSGPPRTEPGVTDETNYGPVQPNQPDNDPLPQQIHLTYWKQPSLMLVSFVTGLPKQSPSPVTNADLPKLKGVRAFVKYGKSPRNLNSTQVSNMTFAYIQNNNYNETADHVASPYTQGYVSGRIHHVLLRGLEAGTTYFYQVAAAPNGPWSAPLNFTTLPRKAQFPFRIGYMGDLGNSYNASTTVEHMVASKPKFVCHMGDVSYADTYTPNGTYYAPEYKYLMTKGLKYHLSYQAAWDQNGRMLQQLAGSVPMAVMPGNHELEFQPDGTVFAAYNTRFPVPQLPGLPRIKPLAMPADGQPLKDPINMYYSFDIPGIAHMVFLSNYIPYDTWGADTAQYKWLAADLETVNRKATPWLIVHMHAPLVTSWEGSFKDAECMRLTYEPLLFKHGVDLFFNGHTHAYERMYPNYNYTMNDCGIVHITIGNGGKPGSPEDALDTTTIEDACASSPFNNATAWVAKMAKNPTIFGPVGNCPTVQPHLGGFCWSKGQPDFSAVRTAVFGHGTLDILNATHAEWTFYRNSDAPGVSMDKVMLNRGQPTTCASVKGTASDQGTASDDSTASDQSTASSQGIASAQRTAAAQSTATDQGTASDQSTATVQGPASLVDNIARLIHSAKGLNRG